jgi:hypothetical protein
MSAQFIRECRKAVVAAVGFASTLVALGALEGTAAKVVLAVIAGLTAAGVYRVPNAAKA